MRWTAAAILALSFALASCEGNDTNDDRDADAGARADAAAGDASAVDSGATVDSASSLACGDTTCAGDQVCVHPCNCGVPECLPLPDSGQCPDGLSPGECPGSGETMCVGCPPPPPPRCAPRPAGCDGDLACGCLEADPCLEWGSCGFTDGTHIECLCA